MSSRDIGCVMHYSYIEPGADFFTARLLRNVHHDKRLTQVSNVPYHYNIQCILHTHIGTYLYIYNKNNITIY